jgi:hypothetical protein
MTHVNTESQVETRVNTVLVQGAEAQLFSPDQANGAGLPGDDV